MKTNFQMLTELLKQYDPAQRGIMSNDEYELITKSLCLDDMDVLALRNLRDFTVLHLSRSEAMKDWDRMSAITHCIDMKIGNLGGEV